MAKKAGQKKGNMRPGRIKEIAAAAGLAGVLAVIGLAGLSAAGHFFSPRPELTGDWMNIAQQNSFKDPAVLDPEALSETSIAQPEAENRREEQPGAEDEAGQEWTWEEEEEYRRYRSRLDGIENQSQLQEMGFSLIPEHSFPVEMTGYGTLTLLPAMDEEHRRLGLFFADEEGKIQYRTDLLETNYQNKGKLEQWNEGIAAVSFVDMNEDGRLDIVLVTFCQSGEKRYKVGDVLFQGQDGFYQDWRLSESINQFHMNKSIRFIVSFAKENGSTQFLYTSTTLEELTGNHFQIMTEYQRWLDFEKLGRLRLVPGYYKMAEYYLFMVYLIDEQGYIVWSFQPMGDYENLYELSGIRCCDIDGDGLKDLLILGRYSYDGADGEMAVEKDYSIYYQRTEGFSEDAEMKSWFPCKEDTQLDEILNQAWAYWGWKPVMEQETKQEEPDDPDTDRG